MPVTLEAEIIGLRGIINLPHRFRLESETAVKRGMHASVALLRHEVVKEAPANMGLLRNSFEERVYGRWPDIHGKVSSPLAQAPVMEYGRRAGAPMPPIAPLERWGHLKLGVDGLGFVLARSIARKGIKGRHHVRTAFGRVRPRISRIFDQEMGLIIRALGRNRG